MIESAVYTVLTGNAAIKRRCNTRIYPLSLPQKPTYPAISYQRTSAGVINTLSGYSGLKNPYFVITAWAKTYDECKALSDEIHTAMDGARTFRALMNYETDDFDPDLILYAVSQEYSCWGNE